MKIWERADRFRQEHEALRPPPGTIAAGGAHFDPFLLSNTLFAFLRKLRSGVSVADAESHAKDEAREMIRKWNASRKWQVHRWEGAADAEVERAVRELQKPAQGL